MGLNESRENVKLYFLEPNGFTEAIVTVVGAMWEGVLDFHPTPTSFFYLLYIGVLHGLCRPLFFNNLKSSDVDEFQSCAIQNFGQ